MLRNVEIRHSINRCSNLINDESRQVVYVINDAILARRMDNYCEFEIIYSFMKILKVRV